MSDLRLVSCLGENTYPVCSLLADYLTEQLQQPLHFASDLPWTDACEQLPAGEIKLGWLCGLLYSLQQDERACYQLLGKPVFRGQTSASYHAYVVVHRDSPCQSLADLDGQRLVINDPDSYSGNHVLWAQLATLEQAPRFASVQESGRHSNSMRSVATGAADVAVIDHTVFDYWHTTADKDFAAIMAQLRVLEAIGHAPAPPLVAHRSLDAATVAAIQQALWRLDNSSWQSAFAAAGLERVVAAADADYNVLREAYRRSLSHNTRR